MNESLHHQLEWAASSDAANRPWEKPCDKSRSNQREEELAYESASLREGWLALDRLLTDIETPGDNLEVNLEVSLENSLHDGHDRQDNRLVERVRHRIKLTVQKSARRRRRVLSWTGVLAAMLLLVGIAAWMRRPTNRRERIVVSESSSSQTDSHQGEPQKGQSNENDALQRDSSNGSEERHDEFAWNNELDQRIAVMGEQLITLEQHWGEDDRAQQLLAWRMLQLGQDVENNSL